MQCFRLPRLCATAVGRSVAPTADRDSVHVCRCRTPRATGGFEAAETAHRTDLDRASPTLSVMASNTSSFDGVASMRTTSSLRPNTSITGSVFA